MPLVVGLSGLVTSLQSHLIGQTHSKLFRARDFPGAGGSALFLIGKQWSVLS